MSIFDKFKNGLDTKAINQAIEDAKENKGNYKEVPAGTYDVELDKFEMKKTKTDKDMFSAWFTILDGEFKGCKVFKNIVIWETSHIGDVLLFLTELGSELQPEGVGSMDEFFDFLEDVANDIDDKGYEFEVEYIIDKKGFGKINKVTEILY